MSGVAKQREAKSRILYFDAAKSHIQLMGAQEHHPNPFFSHDKTY